MKKILLSFLLTVVSISSWAYDVEVGGIYYNLNSTDKTATVTYETTDYNSYSGAVITPETIEVEGVTYSVTSIGDGAFCDCTGLTSVTIPNSVTSIGEDAFYNCIAMTSVTIPNSVRSIGDYAFSDCTGLNTISVESGNTVYDSRDNCKAIIETSSNTLLLGCKNTVIPNSVTSIGEDAFHNCIGLTSVTIPNSVTSIGDYAFMYCTGLTSVTIPNSVTSIGNYAFDGCSGLNTISVGSGNTVYDSRDNCKAIIETSSNTLLLGCKNTVIPNSVTSIGSYAFRECTGLTSVTIPNSVTSIGSFAFWYCTGLTSVTIPNSVTSIGEDAFFGCTGLTSVTVPNSVTSIEQAAFAYCTGLTSVDIPNSVTSIRESTFFGCSGLTSVTIPNSVTSIRNYAFRECTGLKTVSIGTGIKNIYREAFASCRNIETVTCYAEEVPTMGTDVFKDSYVGNATLKVPAASVDLYKAADQWMDFGTIQGINGTSIKAIEGNNDTTTGVIYNLSGQKMPATTKGVNIINGKKYIF